MRFNWHETCNEMPPYGDFLEVKNNDGIIYKAQLRYYDDIDAYYWYIDDGENAPSTYSVLYFTNWRYINYNKTTDNIDEIHEKSWIVRLFDNISYYCTDKTMELYYNIRWYIKNRRLFRKMMWKWRPWDSYFQIELFAFGLEQLKKSIENGVEERTSANKKISAIDSLVKELRYDVDSEILFDHDNETFQEYQKRYQIALNEHFNKIDRIMRGQDINTFDICEPNEGDKDGYKCWAEQFDGTGIYSWWD